MLGTAVHAIHNAIAINPQRLTTKGFKQMTQGGIALQVHALHFEQLFAAHTGLDGKAWRQLLADREQYGIGDGCGVCALSGALLTFVAQPQTPFGLPLVAFLAGMHSEQSVGTIALGGCAQGRGVRTFEIGRSRNHLLIQIAQRQTQRQASVLRRPTQRAGDRLTITDEAAAFGGIIQPPAKD